MSIYPLAIPKSVLPIRNQETAIPLRTAFTDEGLESSIPTSPCDQVSDCQHWRTNDVCPLHCRPSDWVFTMNKEIRMSKKSLREIRAEQRARQQRVRDEARNRRRPSRDDLARMLLWKMIMSTEKHHLGQRQALDRLRDEIVDGLELQGFDVRESEDVFEELAGRYADGLFPFRPKRHLKPA
jgi:hypothetical protein